MTTRPPLSQAPLRLSVFLGFLAAACLLPACSDAPKAAQKVVPVVRDIPSVFRGTIGAECSLLGAEPAYVAGYGLVVGLAGTGGGPLPVDVQATMERELARNGLGREGLVTDGPFSGRSPREILADPNVAVVIVEGAMQPGLRDGATFDVFVRTLPGSSVTSLESGMLYTTELRLGPAISFGGKRTELVAHAEGPVFINPFIEPGKAAEVNATRGRILSGGRIHSSLPLRLVLDNPSHARARSIQSAVNARFAGGESSRDQVAQGRAGRMTSDATFNGLITIRIPRKFERTPDEFLQLLRFTQIDQSYPQEYAKRYVEELRRQPVYANEIGLCLQALGKPAVPFLASMYDFGQPAPRLAALRAGANLGDARATPHLKQVAADTTLPASIRSEAITLLGRMPPDPTINIALRDLLSEARLETRIAAYEALAQRADPSIERTNVEGKFILDLVPADDELIYVTQQGLPRVVVFGRTPSLVRPLLVSAWSERLMVTAESETATPRLMYRDYRTNQVVTTEVPSDLRELVMFLAHAPSPEHPEPGLSFTYSQVVGALAEIQTQGGVVGAFATEQDRLMARILEASRDMTFEDRPEFAEGGTESVGEKFVSPENPDAVASGAPEGEEADAKLAAGAGGAGSEEKAGGASGDGAAQTPEATKPAAGSMVVPLPGKKKGG